jgi:predicted amidohydrolase
METVFQHALQVMSQLMANVKHALLTVVNAVTQQPVMFAQMDIMS